jgi:hypothetical protein
MCTQDGNRCNNVVNRSECEYCLYHAKAALKQYSNRRPDVHGQSFFERQLKPVVDKGKGKMRCIVLELEKKSAVFFFERRLQPMN